MEGAVTRADNVSTEIGSVANNKVLKSALEGEIGPAVPDAAAGPAVTSAADVSDMNIKIEDNMLPAPAMAEDLRPDMSVLCGEAEESLAVKTIKYKKIGDCMSTMSAVKKEGRPIA